MTNEADGEVYPMVSPFECDKKGQTNYAAMVGCILMHFINGGDKSVTEWDSWKDFYYVVADDMGLTELDSSRFLEQTCIILIGLGVLDPPDELTFGRDADEPTMH